MSEFRVAGPPGTGKTTWLAEQITRALERHRPESIYVCSYTRAAAIEVASRGVAVPKGNIGTIHALCRRAWDGEGYPTIYAHKTYKKGIQITREAVDDNKYRSLVNETKAIAKTARYTPLMYAAKLYNNAFTVNPAGYASYNGGTLALCSASQTYENGDAGTQSNYSTNALNYDNLDTALVALNTQKDSDGRLLSFTGKPRLVIGPALYKTAVEITDSELDPDTANNAVNVYRGALADVVVNPWMHTSGGATYNTAWFLVSPDAKLNFFWRIKPEFSEEKQFDNDTIKHKVYARWSAGFSNWRGVYGSIGTV